MTKLVTRNRLIAGGCILGALIAVGSVTGKNDAAKTASASVNAEASSSSSRSSSSAAAPTAVPTAAPTAAPTAPPAPTPTPTAAPCPSGFHNGVAGDTYSGCYADPTPTPVPTPVPPQVPVYRHSTNVDCVVHVTDITTMDGLYAAVDGGVGSQVVDSAAAQDYCSNLVDAANTAPDTAASPAIGGTTQGAVVCTYALIYEGENLSVTVHATILDNPGWALAFCQAKIGA